MIQIMITIIITITIMRTRFQHCKLSTQLQSGMEIKKIYMVTADNIIYKQNKIRE